MDSRKNVLVTGANGFLGSGLLRRLRVELRFVSRGVVRNIQNDTNGEIVCVGGIDSTTDWCRALDQMAIVIHCAARAHVMSDNVASPLEEYRKINVDGTLNLARQAASAGVKRFIFISSAKVNGELTTYSMPFTEQHLVNPQDPYGISKQEAEEGLRTIAKQTGMEVVIIRPPLVYGLGVKGSFASLVNWVNKGYPLPLGSIHNQRSLVALDNLVDFISLCADPDCSPKAANETFLISDGEDVSTTELLRKVAKAYGVKPKLLPIPVGLMRSAARLLGKGAMADRLFGNLQVDSSKARNLLGWKPVVTMDEQLAKMVSHDS